MYFVVQLCLPDTTRTTHSLINSNEINASSKAHYLPVTQMWDLVVNKASTTIGFGEFHSFSITGRGRKVDLVFREPFKKLKHLCRVYLKHLCGVNHGTRSMLIMCSG
jgi:hypothetical protein